jgi:hypothetical protein
VYGEGVQDGFAVGPEIRLDVAPFGGFNVGLTATYDYSSAMRLGRGHPLGRPGT